MWLLAVLSSSGLSPGHLKGVPCFLQKDAHTCNLFVFVSLASSVQPFGVKMGSLHLCVVSIKELSVSWNLTLFSGAVHNCGIVFIRRAHCSVVSFQQTQNLRI